jgi:hypothetical protein
MRRPLALLVPLAFAACGGNGTIPIADLTQRVIAANCARDVRCGVYPDEATCEAALAPLDFGQLQANVAAGKSKYDGAAAADCLAALGAGSCSITAEVSTPAPPACARAIQGTLGAGAACNDDTECVSGTCDTSGCTTGASCCAGICAATPTIVALGADCTSPTVACPDDSFCTGGTIATCVAKIPAGQPCVSLTECVAGLLCVSDPTTGNATCGTFPAHGASCTASQFCDSASDYCDLTTGICTSRVAPGGACQPADVSCVAYATCDATTSTCLALGGAGAACTSASACLSAFCSGSGRCAVPPPATVCP